MNGDNILTFKLTRIINITYWAHAHCWYENDICMFDFKYWMPSPLPPFDNLGEFLGLEIWLLPTYYAHGGLIQ